MARRTILFACEEATLVGTLDEAPGTTALLIVTGGNETRAGAWDGQAQLAARIAQGGWPVLRFDRRGVGDSEGDNGGFRTSAPDIAAALDALLKECPHVRRIVGLGNCDGAAALMLAQGRGCDALLLSNPWTIEDESEGEEADGQDGAPSAESAEVARDHYRQRLRDPAAVKRLFTGKVSLPRLARSLLGLLRRHPRADGAARPLVEDLREGLSAFRGPVHFLVAERDRTGRLFASRWGRNDPRIKTCPGATHSYVEPEAREWLFERISEALGAEGIPTPSDLRSDD